MASHRHVRGSLPQTSARRHRRAADAALDRANGHPRWYACDSRVLVRNRERRACDRGNGILHSAPRWRQRRVIRLLEDQTKEWLREAGLVVPRGAPERTPEDAARRAEA